MNGNFIFYGIEKARAPPLEATLRELPLIANPEISREAFRESKEKFGQIQKRLGKQLYFEVRPDLDSDMEEYLVTPLRTYHVTGVMNYRPSGNDFNNVKILSVWDDLLEVQFGVKAKPCIFSLFFRSYENPHSTVR